MLMLPPPPPPPPEPEKLPEPEPDPVKPEVVEPEPTPVEPLDAPKDDSPPSPSKDLGDPVTIDGAAQAGTDALRHPGRPRRRHDRRGPEAAWRSGSYARYVSSVLQQALSRDPRTRQLAFDDIRIDLWLGRRRHDHAGATGRKAPATPTTDEAVLAHVARP